MNNTFLPLVSIVITNYNSKNFITECIHSIMKSNYKNFEIIIVDNASTDNSIELCKKEFPEVRIIYNKKNLGSAGRNTGIKIAKGKFIAILDSDVKVTKFWLDELLHSYNKFGYGLYQAKLLFMDKPDIINSVGCMLNVFGFSYARGTGEIDLGQYDNLFKINFTSGACTFAPTEIFKKVGFYDEEFFAYVEDSDFGWRALKLGISSYFVPKSVIYHKGSPTMQWNKKKFYLLERNRQIMLYTLYSKSTFLKLLPFLFLVELGTWFYYLQKGMLSQKLCAYYYILKNQKYLSNRNTKINTKNILTDSHIIKEFSDSVWVPSDVMNKKTNTFFNRIFKNLSIFAKAVI